MILTSRRRLRAAATFMATVLAGLTVAAVTPASAATGAAGVGDPYFPDDGNSGYNVGNYDVHIAYDPAVPDRLVGDTTVSATATTRLDRFDLDLSGFDVGSVTVDGVPAREFSRSGAHELVITPRTPVRVHSQFAVRVRYSGKPAGEGWYTFDDGGAVAMGEPHSATAWYPADDHPSDKATFHLTATVPDGWKVMGDGLPGVTMKRNGRTTFRWHEDRPIATYLSTVAIDDFTVHRSIMKDGTPVIEAYSPGTSILPDSEALVPEVVEFLESKFGPYPFSATGATVVSSGPDSLALETAGRPTYVGAFFDASMVHELTHQWFGDQVSISDWRDGCLNECFAQYSYQLWQEHEDGSDLDKDFYASEIEQNRDNPDFWNTKLYDAGPGKELDPALYDKGSLMVHALRRAVGDGVFFPMLRQWLAVHRYANASWPQFEVFAQQFSGRDLTGFFQAWAHGTTIPPQKYLYPGSLAPLAP